MNDRPVGDETDQELRLVMTDLADAAPPAPDHELISSPSYVTDNGEVSEMRRTRWIVAGAGAAAALVLVLVGVAVANTSDDEVAETAAEGSAAASETATDVPAPDAETASQAPVSDLELATQFLDDLYSLETEAAVAAMETDAVVNYLAARGTDDIAGLQGVMEARDWEFTAENCREVAGVGAAAADESTTKVACDVTFEDAVSKAAGFDPYSGSLVTVWIEDAAVTLLRFDFAWPRHDAEVAAPLRVWLSVTHPEDQKTMYDPEGIQPAVTPESIALWEEYTAEYIAETYG